MARPITDMFSIAKEEWVSVTDYGEVWEFGDGEQKVRYDEAKHKDNFPWLDKYKEG